MKEDTTATVRVLDNDHDKDGRIVTDLLAIVTKPQNGTARVLASGKITYTPDLNFNGNDDLTYEIADDDGAKSRAMGRFTVTAVNDPPIANDDSVIADVNTPIVIEPLLNDVDPDESDAEIMRSSLVVVTLPDHGTVSVDSVTGSIIFTPEPDFVGPTQFT